MTNTITTNITLIYETKKKKTKMDRQVYIKKFSFSVFLVVSMIVSLAHGKKAMYFGFYGADLAATPYASIYQAETITDATAAFTAHKITSLLSVYNTVFTWSPQHTILQPEWRSQLVALMAAAESLFASGAVIGFNLGDELIWNCLTPANLTLVADAVREQCPRGTCIIWHDYS